MCACVCTHTSVDVCMFYIRQQGPEHAARKEKQWGFGVLVACTGTLALPLASRGTWGKLHVS